MVAAAEEFGVEMVQQFRGDGGRSKVSSSGYMYLVIMHW